MPKVSIITPIYCDISAKIDWLDEMIQSVQSQTLTDWEIVLINDKSPLPLDPVRMKHATDSRLRWIENAQNFGPAMTRNTAVELAESECILPLDSDDMLANSEVLENMYDAWIMDNTKIIYGNLQMYKQISKGVFQRGKVITLGEYSFELAMNLGGIMPVTAMHSKECHYKTITTIDGKNVYGWKNELDLGLEDVEYWIAAGEHGFCGQKINVTTLVYRQQETSRAYMLKHINQKFEAMQHKIKALHSDIYKGVFPVACCGKSSSQPVSDPLLISQQGQGSEKARIITTLAERGYNFDDKEIEWVAYRGPKQGSAGRILIRGPANLPSEYQILGNGHVFQIHKQHKKTFSDRQKLGFEMNQPDPRAEPEPELKPVEIAIPEPQITEIAKPQMSTIVRMDSIAARTKEADIQKAGEPVLSKPKTQLPTDHFKTRVQASLHVSNIGLSEKLTVLLDKNGYTVEKLAEVTPQKLSLLPGIGIKRANSIIAKAKELINNQ